MKDKKYSKKNLIKPIVLKSGIMIIDELDKTLIKQASQRKRK